MKTMDEKLQEQVGAPAKRRAKQDQEAEEALDNLMAWMDERIKQQEEKDKVWKVVAGIFGVIVFFLGVYSLGIYIATSG